MQHLWLTERIVDIVATELGLDPVEVRKKNYVKTEQMPYETPNGCVYDSGDYAAALDIALDLIDHGSIEERREADAREAPRARDRLDARLRHEQLRAVDAPEPRPPVLREQRGGVREARHLRRGRGHARHRPAGAGPRDDRGAGRRRHPRLLAGPGERATRARHVVQLARRLLGHVREPVRVHGSRRGQGRRRAAARGDDQLAAAVLQAPPRRSSSRTAIKDRGPRRPRCRSWRSARSSTRTTRFLPPEFNPTLNHRYVCRPYFGMVDTEKKTGQLTLTYATQIHAAVVEIDPETGEVDVVDYAAVDDCGVQDQPADRRGPGARRDAMRSARRCTRIRLRRGGDAPDRQLLRLPRAARDGHAALKTGAMESPSPVAPLGAKGMGEGGGGGIHCICAAIQGMRCGQRGGAIVTTAATRA